MPDAAGQGAGSSELAQRGDDRQPGGADGGEQAADESHQQGVEGALHQQFRGDGEGESDLLKVCQFSVAVW